MSHDDHEHGDATLDAIALTEAAIRDDDDGYEAILKGITEHGSVSHVLGTLSGVLAEVLTRTFGQDGALQHLAHQRGGELTAADDNEHVHHHHEHTEPADLGDVAYELGELNEKTDAVAKSLDEIAASLLDYSGIGDGIVRLIDAVARVGDILDKRLT